MQSSTCLKDTFHEGVCSQTAFVFGNSHEFSTSNGMFYPYSDAGDLPVEGFLFIRKFFVFLCRYKSHCLKTQTQNMGKAVHKCVTMLLVHTETGSMVLLKRVVFQIYKNKEKPLRDIRQRAILVYAETATVTSPLTIEFVLTQIIIMRGLEIGKQMRKLNMSQARQGTETFGIIFMVGIIYATKVHAYAIYNKSNLH